MFREKLKHLWYVLIVMLNLTAIGQAFSKFNSEYYSAWDRMSAAGAQLMTWFAVACELHGDWHNDVQGLGELFAEHIPDYRNLINSYTTLTSK